MVLFGYNIASPYFPLSLTHPMRLAFAPEISLVSFVNWLFKINVAFLCVCQRASLLSWPVSRVVTVVSGEENWGGYSAGVCTRVPGDPLRRKPDLPAPLMKR